MLNRTSLLRGLVTLAAVAIAIVAGWFLWVTYEESPWTRDGRVRADIVTVTPDVSGVVVEVKVIDNQDVKVGDVLFVIDQARYKIALEQAQAVLAGAEATRDQRQHDYERRSQLSAIAISSEALESAKNAALAAQADYGQAVAALDTAKLNMARTEVRAPVNGHVTNVSLRPGDYATAGRAMLAMVDSDSFYVAGYFEETKLRSIKIGDRVSIRLLGFDSPLEGHVESVARAITDRDNALGNDLIANVNPTFNWVRLAQRIPVRIAIDRIPDGITLSAGMTATVVVTGRGNPTRDTSQAP